MYVQCVVLIESVVALTLKICLIHHQFRTYTLLYKMKMTNKQAKGFTLVELLVVIAIIATLASLATPVILKSLTKAKIVTSKNICVSIESAVDRFENDYSYLPFEGTDSPTEDTPAATPIRSDGDLMAVLAGVEETVNYKKIKFFTLDAPKGVEGSYKDGMIIKDKTAKLYDVWGERYYFMLDYDLDGEIENPFKSGDKNNIFSKKILVFSSGPDGPEKKAPEDGATNKVLKLIPSNFIR